jgi:hypothetical protein
MTLLEMRTKLVQLSGRYDLVINTDDYEDNGANFHINAGLRWLDRKMDHKPMVTRNFSVVAASALSATFEWCRSILQVWVIDPVEGTRTRLEKKDLTWLREEFPGPHSELEAGAPIYYVPFYTKMYPLNPGSTTWAKYSDFNSELDETALDTDVYDGVLFMPPALNEMTLEIIGHFYTKQMTLDTDSNYWSVRHPEILLMSALRSIEVFNRNTEGRKDWELAIAESLMDEDKDAADEDVAEVDEMEG